MELNISTMSFTNMLNNVGLRLQPCRSPTKGVNDAVFYVLLSSKKITLDVFRTGR